MLYPNPYLVVTPQGYSKHYYAGSERIASSIGGDGLPEETIIEVQEERQVRADNLFENVFNKQIELINYDLPDSIETYEKGVYYLKMAHPWLDKYLDETSISEQQDNASHASSSGLHLQDNILAYVIYEKDNDFVRSMIEGGSIGFNSYQGTFYSHSDHLGSAAWVTTGDWYNGTKLIQHMQYLPWGEVFADQRAMWYEERFTFSGKERDAETGYSYFGYRYYLSHYGIWGGVDPLSDKYPGISPYAYCGNNPIMKRDPDGREIVPESRGEWKRQMSNIRKNIRILQWNRYISEGSTKETLGERVKVLKSFYSDIKQLKKSKQKYALNPLYITKNDEGKITNVALLTYDAQTNIITLNYNGKNQLKGTDMFIHEGTHALQFDNGKLKIVPPYNIQLEVPAYINQAAFDPSRGNFKEIDCDWIENIKDHIYDAKELMEEQNNE